MARGDHFYGRGGGPEDDDEPRPEPEAPDVRPDLLVDMFDEWAEFQERVLEHEDHFRGDR